jgi:hypothetical protein
MCTASPAESAAKQAMDEINGARRMLDVWAETFQFDPKTKSDFEKVCRAAWPWFLRVRGSVRVWWVNVV